MDAISIRHHKYNYELSYKISSPGLQAGVYKY